MATEFYISEKFSLKYHTIILGHQIMTMMRENLKKVDEGQACLPSLEVFVKRARFVYFTNNYINTDQV